MSFFAAAVMNEAAPTTVCTITIPAVAVDDFLLVHYTSRGHVLATADPTCTDNDAGGNLWTLVVTDSTNEKGGIFRKKATAGTSAKTITLNGTVTAVTAVLTVHRGTVAVPLNALTQESNVSGDLSHAAITPATADEEIVLTIVNQTNDQASTGATGTAPAVYTKRAEVLNAAGGGCTTSVWSANQSGGPTSTGTVSWTLGTNAGVKTFLFALTPTVVVNPPVVRKGRRRALGALYHLLIR